MARNGAEDLGRLEVVIGPMKGGKTVSLIRDLITLDYDPRTNTIVFKPSIDDRFEGTHEIVSRPSRNTQLRYPAIPIPADYPEVMLHPSYQWADLFAIDEGQFFDMRLIDVVRQLRIRRKKVIVAGLSSDFAGRLFGPMPYLIADANEVKVEPGRCDMCGTEATRTQRLLTDGVPAPLDSPLVIVGGDERYQVRCLEHHYVPETLSGWPLRSVYMNAQGESQLQLPANIAEDIKTA